MTPKLTAFAERNAGFRQYCEQYNRAASSPETQDEYYRWVNEQMRQQGMIQGAVKKAEERAERRRTREIARSLLSSNMPIADVAKHTGLSEDEIKKLCKDV
ncbi:MAG: hypothetical protein LBS62_12090 [Clostridiales bacterium]|nr:hypothetical protein [Clostridiales bacterium]